MRFGRPDCEDCVELLFFGYFAAVIALTAVLVVALKNPIYSALSLLIMFFHVAGLYVTLHAEFLAGVQVIVYVGGILVLFVFVIMLIALERSLTERQYHRQKLFAVLTSLGLGAAAIYAVIEGQAALPPVATEPSSAGNAETVGMALYQQYLLPFEIASILLLVAIVGAVALAKKRAEAE